MPTLLARALALVLCAAAGTDPAGPRTPVFRGTLGLAGRAIALFEVQGKAGTWQGEAGRTLPGTRWTIQAIDLAHGTVTIRVNGGAAVTLAQGQTYAQDRVAAGADPVRAPGPLASLVPVVRALDARAGVPPLAELARPGYTTVIMLTSATDPRCQREKPRVLHLVAQRARTAVVFLEVGSDAPRPLPHYVVMDPAGRVTASGEEARALVSRWMDAR